MKNLPKSPTKKLQRLKITRHSLVEFLVDWKKRVLAIVLRIKQ
nr:MAG TPA: hypothetical protein [Caudoviricetes sp.]DAW40329.1 MAG TPA: hypothetical protein [Caudoviricetes sp.]